MSSPGSRSIQIFSILAVDKTEVGVGVNMTGRQYEHQIMPQPVGA